MRIVLATVGSRGDVQPMLALCLALRAAGHDALLAGPPERAAWASALGCPYRPLGRDVTAMIDAVDRAHTLRAAPTFVSYVRGEIDTQFRQLPRIAAGADMAVGAALCFAMASVAERLGIPYRYVAFTPQVLPSAEHPNPIIRSQRLPGWMNRLGWDALRIADRFHLTALLNRRRRALGLSPVRDGWENVLGRRVVVAADREVASVPADVPCRTVQTGYMHLRLPHRRLPALEKFLAAGPPPVYAGFGSMPAGDQARLIPRVTAAARLAGCRLVTARPGGPEGAASNGGNVFFLGSYPHARLFPRMAAVVHHGGAGTTAVAAAAGVPQIIVPHILDQYYWGERVFRSGLGPAPIGRARLTARRLAAALRRGLTDPRLRRRAREAAARIRRDDGAHRAAAEIVAATGPIPLVDKPGNG